MSPTLVSTDTTTRAPIVEAKPELDTHALPPADHSACTIPANELYWALLETKTLGAIPPRQLRSMVAERSPALDELLAAKLPLAMDEVHAIYAMLPDDRVLACAVPRDTLHTLKSSNLLALTPDALPAGISSPDFNTAELNFLVGAYEPKPIRAARHRVTLITAGSIILAAALAIVGLERRTADIRAAEATAHAATGSVIRQVLGHDLRRDDGAAQIEAELLRLRQTRMRPDTEQEDAPRAIAALFAAWPRGEGAPHVRTDAITVGRGGISLSITADDRAAAVGISEALRAIKGWTLLQPQMSAADDRTGSVRLQLRLVPAEPESAASSIGGQP